MSQTQTHRRTGLITLALLVSILLGACNYPGLRQATEPSVDLIATSAAQTVQAQLTLLPVTTAGQMPLATETLSPNVTATGAGQPTSTATSLVATQAESTATPRCDLVKFVEDVTIPDNTELSPGETFIKTWRLQNAGHCAWNSSYTLVYEGDNVFNAPLATAVTSGTVSPGSSVDVSVTLTAPQIAGEYRQNFMLANAGGERFGLGNGSKPFWVQAKVVAASGIVLDFISQAANAEWKSGAGASLNVPLTFGGADDDANGVAKIKDNVKLENGVTSGKILLTYPLHQPDGIISGVFPPYLVQKGDRLITHIGFMLPGGVCGPGRVKFQIHYQEGANITKLGEWQKNCNGSLYKVTLDLSPLAGKTVQFIFVANADGDYTDDWAIWNSARIER